MNILVFSWRDPRHPLAGGAEQVMHEHMKGWIEAGHSVTLFASRFKGSSAEEVLQGVHIVRGGNQHHLGVQFAGFLYYEYHKREYDLVVDQFHGMPFFTPLYVKKPKFAVIQETARNVWFLNPFPWPINWIYGVVGYVLEPLIFLLYKKTPFMTGSKSAKEDVVNLGIPKENITVVPHGVVIPKLKIKYQKAKMRTIVYLGVLSKDKGVEDAIKCFSILDKKGNYQFWVIGKPETEGYGRKVINQVESLGLDAKVKFWGFVSQEKKFELLAKGHVLINPSVHEGWGLVNIEANAMETPVIAYRSHGLIDSVKDGQSGILCTQNTSEELAKNTMRLLADKAEYKRLQDGAILWSKNFSWEKSRKRSLDLLKKVVR
ncbi:MAG: glycosyltransferase family 4 protein [bacterium]|nr:glycosyltransferase family 4 protein [bacterium]